MKKKVMTFLFCLCMVFAAALWSSENMIWAQEKESDETIYSEDGNYAYRELEDGTIEIRSIWCDETELVIPDRIDGKVVTSIGGCPYQVEHLTLPEGILSIGDSAFISKENLVEVRLPESLEYIGEDAFGYCDNLEIINLPDNIRFIGESAFYGCSKLSSITLPKNLSSLEKSAFSDCSGLEEIIFQKGIKSIGEYAFSGCSSLKEIILPEGVLSIGEYAFDDCSSLEKATISGSSIGTVFYGCDSLKEVTLLEGMESIGDSAFSGLSSLEKVTMSEGIKSIGEYAFRGCSSLKEITLPEGILSIGDYAFRGCSSLEKGTISGSIGEYVFEDCNSLKEVTMLDGTESIGYGAFDDCSSLEKVTMSEGVTSIERSAFYKCLNLKEIVLADTITSIGPYAFGLCSSLKEITLPKGLLSIEDSLFSGCTSLENLIVPENVKSIGEYPFNDCDSLKSVSLPKNVQLISEYIFSGCKNLTDLWYGGSKAQLKKLYDYDESFGLRDMKVRVHCSDGTVIANYDNAGSSIAPQTKPSTQVPVKPTPVRLGDSNVSLSTASVVYTGALQKPAVIVKDSKGRIVGAANYLLIYSNNINVGQAAVTVYMKGSYTGTVKKTFDILPKGTSITKITPKKKSISLKWKKQTVQTSGYQIQYSLKKNFQGAKITKKIPLKKNSFKLSKLKAKKKYFTRIRTYKTVNGRDYYSEWSIPKSTKTKK